MAKLFDPIGILKAQNLRLSQVETRENLAKFLEPSAIRTKQSHGTVEVGNPGASSEHLGFTEFRHKSEIKRLRPPEGVKGAESASGYPGDDIGFHFGTPDQAYIRMKDKSRGLEGSTFRQGQVEDFHLQVKNPLIVTGDAGDWTSAKEINSILPEKYQAKTVGEIRRNIQKDGFDGIIYPNEHERIFPGIGERETPFQNSTIIFNRRQAKSAKRNIGTYDITKADFTKAAVPAAVVGGASIASAQEVEPQRKVNGVRIGGPTRGMGAPERPVEGGFRPDDPIDQVLFALKTSSADKLKVDSDRQLPFAKPIQEKGLPELPKDPEMKITSREDFHKFSGGRKQVLTREESIREAEKTFAGGMVGGPLEYTGIGDILDVGRAIKDPSAWNVVAATAGTIPFVGPVIKSAKQLAEAALKMKKSARLKRAAEQGYTIDGFHGTKGRIETSPTGGFDPGKLGETTGAYSATQAFFFSKDTDTAGAYSRLASSALRQGDLDKGIDKSINQLTKKGKSIDKELAKIEGEFGKELDDFAKKYPRNPNADWDGRTVTFLDELHNKIVRSGMAPSFYTKLPSTLNLENIPLDNPYIKEMGDRTRVTSIKEVYFKDGIDKLSEMSEELALFFPKESEDFLKILENKSGRISGWRSPENMRRHQELMNSKNKLLTDHDKRVTDIEESFKVIIPVKLRMEDPFIYDFKSLPYRETRYGPLIEKARKAGHDSFIFKNTKDGADITDVYGILPEYAHNIRSHDARFDPDLAPRSTKGIRERKIFPMRKDVEEGRKELSDLNKEFSDLANEYARLDDKVYESVSTDFKKADKEADKWISERRKIKNLLDATEKKRDATKYGLEAVEKRLVTRGERIGPVSFPKSAKITEKLKAEAIPFNKADKKLGKEYDDTKKQFDSELERLIGIYEDLAGWGIRTDGEKIAKRRLKELRRKFSHFSFDDLVNYKELDFIDSNRSKTDQLISGKKDWDWKTKIEIKPLKDVLPSHSELGQLNVQEGRLYDLIRNALLIKNQRYDIQGKIQDIERKIGFDPRTGVIKGAPREKTFRTPVVKGIRKTVTPKHLFATVPPIAVMRQQNQDDN